MTALPRWPAQQPSPDVPDDGPDQEPSAVGSGLARHRRRRRIKTGAGLGVLLLVVVAAAIFANGIGGRNVQRAASTGLPPATAPVTRTTLIQTERLGGLLSYGPAITLIARASATPPAGAGGNPGTEPPSNGATPTPSPTPYTTNTLTWLSPPGSVVKRGQPVYKVDNRSVVLLTGDTPLFRILAEGLRGPDVRILEENLRALGYSGLIVDDVFTSATTFVVKRWQRDLGLAQTGTVDVNQVVVVPSEIRVAEHRSGVGRDANGEVLTVTGTTRLVTIPLEVTRQHLVQVGLSATVTLPDNRTVTGTVAAIGTVASAGDGGGGPQESPTIDATLTIADQAALGTLDSAPVSLTIVVAERKDVLTVPIGALVALAEGGYGVQVVEGSTTRYVAVKTGMFASGKVEVEGVAEGTLVGVPA